MIGMVTNETLSRAQRLHERRGAHHGRAENGDTAAPGRTSS